MAWAQNSYLLFLEQTMMEISNVIFDGCEIKKYIKIPSIHWQVTGNRTPEQKAGLIVNQTDDYSEFFKVAHQNKFGIVFDGLAIDQREDCQSDPSVLINIFRENAKKY